MRAPARAQLEAAKRRIAAFVVLDLDWLHLSAPLLCASLGYCGPRVAEGLAAAAGHRPCGLNETLEELGMTTAERDAVGAELGRRNALDMELYAFARRQVLFVVVLGGFSRTSAISCMLLAWLMLSSALLGIRADV